jgi:hypothetical protein
MIQEPLPIGAVRRYLEIRVPVGCPKASRSAKPSRYFYQECPPFAPIVRARPHNPRRIALSVRIICVTDVSIHTTPKNIVAW